MSITETTSKSWFSRLGGAIAGIFFGFIVVIAANVFLFMNEGWSIHTYRALVEGQGVVVSVDSGVVDAANDGKLVHLSGAVKTEQTPQDSTFGIEAPGAVGLARTVETYQWVEDSKSETKTKLGGGEETVTTYSYSKDWKSDFVDSSKFKQPDGHFNPRPVVDGSQFIVKDGTVGAFHIDGNKLFALGDTSSVQLTSADAETFKTAIGSSQPVGLSGGKIYVGQSATSPQVGDIQIGYERTDLSEASIVAKQSGTHLSEYEATNGNTIFLTASGTKTAAAMFETAQTENTIFTWIIRVAGMFGIFIGFIMMFSIFGVIGDVIPFVGSIIRFGTSFLAFVLTMIIGPVVIAIGWFAYRPLLSIAVIAVGLLLAFGVIYMRRGKAAQLPADAKPV